jgi:hypothetical protein
MVKLSKANQKPTSVGVEREPLPSQGVEVLVTLMTHQDLITWAALTVFFAAETALLYLKFTTHDPNSIAILFWAGVLTTGASWAIFFRSYLYMVEYVEMAKRRSHAQDHEIFDVSIAGPGVLLVVAGIHLAFLAFWLAWGH